MTEEIVTAGISLSLAAIAAAYKLGYDRSKRTNGVNMSQYMTKELCVERHKVLADKLDAIATAVQCLPDIKAWVDLQKRREERR